MDEHATVEQLKAKVKKFCEARDWDQFHGPKDLAIGIITESSELLEHFRFKTDEQSKSALQKKTEKKEIEEELADILFFVLRFAQRFEIDLTSILDLKIKKNEKYYPISKSKGSNKKYDEL